MTSSWYKIAEHENELSFAANNIAITEVKGKKICIVKFSEELFATSYTCPHASGIMAHGYVDAIGNIVCPTHRYKFSLKNGRNISGEGYFLKTWKVEKREEGIYVEM